MFDDIKLHKAVLAELNRDPSVPAAQIGVAASGGVVTLTGHVGSYAAKYAAEHAAARVDVLDVRDDIGTALHRSPFFDTDTVKVSVDGGTVRLSGSVDTLHDRRVAEKTAWAAPGAVKVENLLEVV